MTPETSLIIVASIGTAGVIVTAVLTFITNRTANKTHKGMTKVVEQTNGVKDELVSTAKSLGEEIGKAKGRKEVTDEIVRDGIFVIILDDSSDDLELIERTLKKNGITKYKGYRDTELFIEALTRHLNVYIIDHFLSGGKTGLNILYEIQQKNENNFVIVCTGSENERTMKDYVNAGADKIIFKSDQDYLLQLDKYVREGLRVLSMRK